MLAPFVLALVAIAPQQGCAPGEVQQPEREVAPSRERPRIGLVLSSGGAHTLAQVGALEALEELRIPVDFVVGSGAGALVGGVYAAGWDAGELRAMLAHRTWLDALSGKVPRTLLSWRQRSVDRDFLFDLPVAFGPGRIGLARGVARTRWMSWLLSSATLRTAGAADFDDLPIAFRAVATDLLRGESVVLDAGDLPAAILAALATPGLYAPVRLDGRELASGALLDPIPVGVALDAGCDVLIVVDCALDLDRPQRIESFLSTAGHVRVLAGEAARRAALARLRPGDVHLTPDPGATDEDDFRSALDVFGSGYAAVRARAADLSHLALDAEAWQRHLAQRGARRPAPPVIGAVRFEDATRLDDEVLRDRLAFEVGTAPSEEQVSLTLLRLYGLDYHERIDTVLEPRSDGHADLLFRTHEASDYLWNPRAGVALEGVFGQDATFVLGASFTLRPIGGRGAEWRNRVEVGSRIFLFSEFWQPIDRSARWFVAPALGYLNRRVNVTDGEDVLASLDVWAVGGRLDFGRTLSDWGEARVGVVKQAGHVEVGVGPPDDFGGADFDQGFYEAGLTMDTVDSLALPRQGTIGRVAVTAPAEWLGGEQESYLQSQVDHAIPLGRASLVLGAEFDTALDDETALHNAFPLGGFLRLSGLGRDQISGAHVGLARAVTFVELGRRGLDRRLLDWNCGASLEAGQAWNARDDIQLSDLRWGGSVFVGVGTPFGAVFLGAGATEPGEAAVFLVFGNLFGDWAPF
ncbi:MAG: patatin-like phospholipase family protein [Planctomycetes bacterium]|nr:patatin-like phospholipase family protein [Planctomycetota bacterium]